MVRFCALLIAGGLALAGKEPPPGAAAQAAMLDGVKRTAGQYQAELPDFVCTLLTRRSTDSSGGGKHFKQVDTDEVQFTYVSRVPNREVLKVNGKPARMESLSGFRSDGLLPVMGFLPEWMFGAQSKTRFEWSRWDTQNGRRVAVFALRLRSEDSELPFSNNRGSVMVGLHGSMFVDPATDAVLRLEFQLEVPPGPPLEVRDSSFDLDYGPVTIAGQEFFLPVRTVAQMRNASGIARNETEVVRYQKYSADSSVTFK